VSSFDVRLFAVRRRPGRKAFEVRWRVAGRDRSRSFMTRALADSYRAELVRATRQGQAFDPATGEPAAWVTPEPAIVAWYRHAAAYAEMNAPRAAIAVSRATVASPAQVRAIVDQVTCIRPELAAFFGCLYYAALRPEETVALRSDDLILPARGRGSIILTAACPRTGTAWTSTVTPHEPRGLKHRPGGAIRVVSIPPVLAHMLRHHLRQSAPRQTGDCSPAPAAGCSASRSTGVPGTPPATPRSARNWPPRRWPAAPTTCGMPPCRCG
jgi:integrase